MYQQRFCLFIVISLIGVYSFGVSSAQSPIEFPALSGPYAVGMQTLALVDESRLEHFSEESGDKREVLVHLYYPAEATNEPYAPYLSETEGPLVSEITGIPFSIYQSIQSHHYANAPLLAGSAPYPVLLFSPGLGVPTLFYRSLLEDLASQGYVVAALHHSYSNLFTFFPDGRVLLANTLGYDRLSEATTLEGAEQAAEEIGQVWLADVLFVLEALAQRNSAPTGDWSGQLDLQRVGVFGHSFGGQTSLAASLNDPRIVAAVNLDGSLFGSLRERTARVPSLIWLSEPLNPSDAELAAFDITREEVERDQAQMLALMEAFLAEQPNTFLLSLKGMAHNTFVSDWVLLADTLPAILTESLVGTLDGLEAHQLIRETLSRFFAAYVQGQGVFELPSSQ